jgi:hypothetical protein
MIPSSHPVINTPLPIPSTGVALFRKKLPGLHGPLRGGFALIMPLISPVQAEAGLAGAFQLARRRALPASASLYGRAITSPAIRSLSSSLKRPNPSQQPSPIGLGFGGSSSPPVSYFQRPSLPANTVIKFVPQQTAWIVERMGKFNRVLPPGLAILVPVVDRIAYVKSLKEVAIEIPSQSAITADNVTLELDGVLYTRVVDAYKAR